MIESTHPMSSQKQSKSTAIGWITTEQFIILKLQYIKERLGGPGKAAKFLQVLPFTLYGWLHRTHMPTQKRLRRIDAAYNLLIQDPTLYGNPRIAHQKKQNSKRLSNPSSSEPCVPTEPERRPHAPDTTQS